MAVATRWRWFTGLGLVALVAFFALPRGSVAQGMVFAAASLLTTIAIVLGLRRHGPGRPRTGWRVLAVSFALVTAGNVLWYVNAPLSHDVPFSAATTRTSSSATSRSCLLCSW